MAETKIEWTAYQRPDGTLVKGYTFNGWIGCTEDEDEPGVTSPECAHCYARDGQNHRVSKAKGLPLWGTTAHRQVTSLSYWKQPLRWNKEAEKAGERRRVFAFSLGDIFEDFDGPLTGNVGCVDTIAELREHVWQTVDATPNLDWLMLTKRPQNVMTMTPVSWRTPHYINDKPASSWPHNVWIGTTAGTQRGANRRIPELLRIPAPVRFVSYEPALEAVDFSHWLPHGRCEEPDENDKPCGAIQALPQMRLSAGGVTHCPTCGSTAIKEMERGIDWLIVGGESGDRARPFDIAWARAVRDQCAAARVPFFFKQAGAAPHDGSEGAGYAYEFGTGKDRHWRMDYRLPDGRLGVCEIRDKKGGNPEEWPEDLRVRQIPESAALPTKTKQAVQS